VDVRPVLLEGRTVRLEPLGPQHLDGLAAIAFDPDLWQTNSSRLENRHDLDEYVALAVEEQRSGAALPFATILSRTGQVVGSTRFGNIVPAHRRVEIGWTWVARPWQRTGVNREAKLLMLSHAFDSWSCRRVEFKTSTRNARSRAALRGIGAVEEGVLRHHMINPDGSMRDSVYFSIIAEEWPGVRVRLTGPDSNDH
jgi:N-acetyltransferase